MYQAGPHDELSVLAKRYGLTTKQKILVERFLQLKPDTLEDIVRLIEKVAEDFAKEAGTGAPAAEPEETPKDWDHMTREEKIAEFTRQLDEEEKNRRQEAGPVGDASAG